MKKLLVLLVMVVVLVNCGWLQAATPTWSDADINKDGKVDALDLAWLSKYWLVNTSYPNEFAYIPAGTFEMGDHHDGEAVALPVHTVTLDSFYMSKYAITNQQYCDYLNSAYPAQIKVVSGVVYATDDASNSYPYFTTSSAATGSPDFGEFSQINHSHGVFNVNIKDGTTDMSNHPMVMVSWYGAAAYCNWRSQQEGLESCYNYDLFKWNCFFTKNGFRLPTEAEWEYAARGGEHSPYYRYPWGDTKDGSMANYENSGDPYETGVSPFTTPVGYYDGGQTPTGTDMANGYGLYDMAGNVIEWCYDRFEWGYYSISPANNPTGPTGGAQHILRGGWWDYDSGNQVARRYTSGPYGRGNSYGFRMCVFASH